MLSDSTVGLVVVDVQRVFVKAVAPDTHVRKVLSRIGAVIGTAVRRQWPVFVTFERDTLGPYALPPGFNARLQGARAHVKTTFAATGLPSFVRDLGNFPHIDRLIIVGSETDVCVLQTALGLRRLGYRVSLPTDCVFSSESHLESTWRRLLAAGAELVRHDALEFHPSEFRSIADGRIATIRPDRPLALVLRGLGASVVENHTDPQKRARLARIRELLLVCAWFGIPVIGPDRGDNLPRELLPRLPDPLALAAESSLSQFDQILVAGVEGKAGDTATWALPPGYGPSAPTVFVVEDAILRLEPERWAPPESATSTTFKSCYYEMVGSVDRREWPRAHWARREERYRRLRVPPESLPRLASRPGTAFA